MAPGADKVGTVWAISAETGKTTWKHEQRAGMMPLVATGGGLIFVGDVEGRFRRSTIGPARCCGRRRCRISISGYPIPTRSTASSTSPSAPARRWSATPQPGMTPEIKTERKPRMYVFALP